LLFLLVEIYVAKLFLFLSVVFYFLLTHFCNLRGYFHELRAMSGKIKSNSNVAMDASVFLNGQIHLPRGVDFPATLPSIRLRSPLRFAHAPLALDLICAGRFILRKRLAHSDRLKSPLTAAAERDQVGEGFPLLLGHAQAESGQV
jgi:hypothetical protein